MAQALEEQKKKKKIFYRKKKHEKSLLKLWDRTDNIGSEKVVMTVTNKLIIDKSNCADYLTNVL